MHDAGNLTLLKSLNDSELLQGPVRSEEEGDQRGYTSRFGIVYVDYKDLSEASKDVGSLVQEVVAQHPRATTFP
ncbi:hypothetical protein MLD38_022814 [Melastoma candidum]|uniref:Uncharacterized protein n=1 Tax=Melastoma candidum TaxID=119954 RepID=A0ACB9QKJ2_9MYRT|nr:hypothetical protein MLD38_022814 [Melastoma candidum]